MERASFCSFSLSLSAHAAPHLRVHRRCRGGRGACSEAEGAGCGVRAGTRRACACCLLWEGAFLSLRAPTKKRSVPGRPARREGEGASPHTSHSLRPAPPTCQVRALVSLSTRAASPGHGPPRLLYACLGRPHTPVHGARAWPQDLSPCGSWPSWPLSLRDSSPPRSSPSPSHTGAHTHPITPASVYQPPSLRAHAGGHTPYAGVPDRDDRAGRAERRRRAGPPRRGRPGPAWAGSDSSLPW